MARSRKVIKLDMLNSQIEVAQENVVKSRKKYDEATAVLKKLLDKRKEIQTEELMEAVLKSRHSYEEILCYIRSETVENDE